MAGRVPTRRPQPLLRILRSVITPFESVRLCSSKKMHIGLSKARFSHRWKLHGSELQKSARYLYWLHCCQVGCAAVVCWLLPL